MKGSTLIMSNEPRANDTGRSAGVRAAAEAISSVALGASAEKPGRPNPSVTIYVRKSQEDARDLSFRIMEGMDPLELLDAGIAIDGNTAVLSVYAVPDSDTGVAFVGTLSDIGLATLAEALAYEQRLLVQFLRERGYTPAFA